MTTNETSPAWSISAFYEKSWALTKRHKKLWIFGLAVALFGSSNDYDSSSSSDSESSSQTEQQSFFNETPIVLAQDDSMEYSLEDITQMSSTETEEDLAEPYIDAYLAQPLALHILSIIGLLISVPTFIAIGAVLFSWSNAALIGSIMKADTEDTVDLFASSQLAKLKVKPMLWLYIVPVLKLTLILGGISLVVAAIFMVTNAAAIWLLLIPVVFVYIWKMIRILYAQIVGARYLVYTENVTGKDAYEKGFEISKTNKTKIFRLGFVNVLVVALLFMVAAIPLGLAGFYAYDSLFVNADISIISVIVTAVLAVILLMPVYFLIIAIYKVFNYSTWHYAYLALNQENKS